MTIRRLTETGQMAAQCDKCFDVVDFEDGEDFNEAKIAIDCDGWKTVRGGAGWINICPDCQ